MPYPAKLHPDDILQAARHLLESSGIEHLTMRNLAAALGVQPSSLYRHFPSRDDVLDALGEQAARELQLELGGVLDERHPRRALREASRTYLAFSRQHPHLYDLLLRKPGDLTPEQLAASAGKHLWNTILQLVGNLSGNKDDTDHAVAFWTFLHGFVTLERSGTFGASGPRGGLEAGLEALLNHMQGASTPGR